MRLLDWLLWRDPLCEEPERELLRRKGCEKNSSKVRRSTGLRRSSPCSSAAQEADRAFLMGSGTCASCLSIARSSATWLAPLKGGLPAGTVKTQCSDPLSALLLVQRRWSWTALCVWPLQSVYIASLMLAKAPGGCL